MTEIPLPARAENRIWNKRAGDSSTPCFVCGRPTDGSRMIRLNDSCGFVILPDDPAEQDGGWFDIGPECAKKLPRGFVRVAA